jgi:hypothetical protein
MLQNIMVTRHNCGAVLCSKLSNPIRIEAAFPMLNIRDFVAGTVSRDLDDGPRDSIRYALVQSDLQQLPRRATFPHRRRLALPRPRLCRSLRQH